MLALLTHLTAILAPVLLISGVGFMWVKLGHGFDQGFATALIANLSAPCLVFSILVQMQVRGQIFAQMGGASVLCLVLSCLLGVVALRALNLSIKVFLTSLAFPNVGNMGLPVCLFAFGQQGMALATIYLTAISTFQFTLGPILASGEFRLAPLFKTPFFYAAFAAIFVVAFHLTVPLWLLNTTSVMGWITLPLMLLALGVALAQFRIVNLGRALTIALLRLGIGLFSGITVALLFGFHGAARGVCIIESAMPIAVFNYLFARLYDNGPEEVAGAVMISTLLSYLMLPFVVGALI